MNTENPIPLKLADIPLHDPWMLAEPHSHTYYLYTSAHPAHTGEERYGVMAYTSRDLIDWQGPQIVFRIPDGIWANPMHGAWAPEVHEYNSQYYLFITLHNRDSIIDQPPDSWRVTHARGTTIAVSAAPGGPFELLQNRPHTPEDFMTLDGTLYVEDGEPWMVYCHEWIQLIDGTMEAVRLSPDLLSAVGDPVYLFKASDAPWFRRQQGVSKKPRVYVTDGPFLYRTKTGRLLMLWSSYENDSYVETIAYSESNTLHGPWMQGEPFVGDDSGHGMLFTIFDNKLMLILHSPFKMPLSRARIFEMEDTGEHLRVVRECRELYGSAS